MHMDAKLLHKNTSESNPTLHKKDHTQRKRIYHIPIHQKKILANIRNKRLMSTLTTHFQYYCKSQIIMSRKYSNLKGKKCLCSQHDCLHRTSKRTIIMIIIIILQTLPPRTRDSRQVAGHKFNMQKTMEFLQAAIVSKT